MSSSISPSELFSALPVIALPGLTAKQSLIVECTWVSMLILTVLFGYTCLSLKRIPAGVQNMIETITDFFENYIADIIGPKGLVFFPLIASIFFFIFTSNFLGIIPGFESPTGDINTTAACALIVFLFYQFVGFRHHGVKYLKKFMGPVPAIAPVMVVMEIISELARPFSLAIRLFANIMGGHLILTLTYAVPILLPAFWMGWETIITAPIQSFVFSLLTMIYLAGAVAEEH